MKNCLKVTTPDPQSQLRRAIAYYRHSSQDRQERSIAIQKDHVRQWALEHGIEIIHEFCDAGLPGCNTDERPAFTEMLNEWIKQRPDFEYILCFDASRLGRFHGSDLLVQAIDVFENHKKDVIYTSADSA
jgi:DNA invertase Pin-like site-specific DNA recombinase